MSSTTFHDDDEIVPYDDDDPTGPPGKLPVTILSSDIADIFGIPHETLCSTIRHALRLSGRDSDEFREDSSSGGFNFTRYRLPKAEFLIVISIGDNYDSEQVVEVIRRFQDLERAAEGIPAPKNPAAQAVERGQELANQAAQWQREVRDARENLGSRIDLHGDPSAKPWSDLRDLGTPTRDTPTDAECVEFSTAQSETLVDRMRRDEATQSQLSAKHGIKKPATRVIPFDPDNVPDVWPPAVTSSAPGSTEKTMSSLEIAEITGLDHGRVMVIVRNILEEFKVDHATFTYVQNLGANRVTILRLPRKESEMVIGHGGSANFSRQQEEAVLRWWDEDKEAEDERIGPVRQMFREDGRSREILGFEEIPASPAAQPELAIFNSSEFGDIRTVMEDGKPLFCAKDVAVALGYARPADAVTGHCKGVVVLPTPSAGGVQKVKFIPESDVYRLVMRSKLPGAERFQDWVMEEVLPTIRKTGRFEIVPVPEVKHYTLRESLVLNLQLLDKNEEQAKLIEEQKPAVEYHDNFLAAKDLYVTRDVAHSIGVPERKLIALLEERKILYRPAGPGTRLRAYGEFVTAGYFSSKPRPGREGYPMEVLFTPKGLKWVKQFITT